MVREREGGEKGEKWEEVSEGASRKS